jgi:uncharacterized protein (TIGR02246 family)
LVGGAFDYFAYDLMAGDEGVADGREVAFEDVEVGAADSAGEDAEEEMVGGEGGARDFFDAEGLGWAEDGGFHVCKPRNQYTVAMPIKYFMCCFALSLGVVAGCSRQQPPDNRAADEATIRNLDAQWSKAAGAHDLDGIVSYYSDDAVLLPPNAPVAASKQSIRASWAPLAEPGVSISWQVSKVEVARSGDLAYSTGTYALAIKDPQGKPVTDTGKFMEVWKRQPDGGWKAVADTYNSDLPAQP